MREFPAHPLEMVRSAWRHRGLIGQMSKRDVIGRYRGSILGLAWSFLNPLLMLAVYTFVFSVVFKARWGLATDESKGDFAIILFVGLIIHGLFAECVNRAPSLIVSHVNYVKKVLFPLEILPWVALGGAVFHAAVSLVMLLAVQWILNGSVPLTALLFPVVMAPLLLGTIGLAWFLAALGVYLRDIGQMTAMFTTVALFVSGVFFPIDTLPERYRFWLELNPLAGVIAQGRQVLVFGQWPDPLAWAGLSLLGALMAAAGFFWFQKTRRGFADVL